MFADTDRLQKTWIPEGTLEYKEFKHVTQENTFLAGLLNEKFKIRKGLLLDVGGREGDIAIQLRDPGNIHLIDPDPYLKLPFELGRFWREKIQNVDLTDTYQLIVCSHVLGYLGTQHVQNEVFDKLVHAISLGGTLVLFYNRNDGYMGDLLKFSKNIHLNGHYDYFDEENLKKLNRDKFDVETKDIDFHLDYDSYEGLARCCWFLFGAMDQDIPKVAAIFLPKLKKDLKTPTFAIGERIVFITRKA